MRNLFSEKNLSSSTNPLGRAELSASQWARDFNKISPTPGLKAWPVLTRLELRQPQKQIHSTARTPQEQTVFGNIKSSIPADH